MPFCINQIHQSHYAHFTVGLLFCPIANIGVYREIVTLLRPLIFFISFFHIWSSVVFGFPSLVFLLHLAQCPNVFFFLALLHSILIFFLNFLLRLLSELCFSIICFAGVELLIIALCIHCNVNRWSFWDRDPLALRFPLQFGVQHSLEPSLSGG